MMKKEVGAESERSVASVPQLPPPKVMGTIVPSYWGILRTLLNIPEDTEDTAYHWRAAGEGRFIFHPFELMHMNLPIRKLVLLGWRGEL
jgi:hypothetical protein